jgi:hypothetical protein
MSIEAMKLALEALEESKEHIAKQRRLEAITALQQAIEQALEQEPVAWKETDEVECPVCKGKGFPWPKCGHITYLERTPPPRQPLTDEEICRIGAQVHGFLLCNEGQWGIEMARAIEAAHGIKEKNT